MGSAKQSSAVKQRQAGRQRAAAAAIAEEVVTVMMVGMVKYRKIQYNPSQWGWEWSLELGGWSRY